jgi:hypothetical protein
MSHPMEPWLDARRSESARNWARRDALERRLKDLPLSAFKASHFPDLQLLYDRSAVHEHWGDLEKALERLERDFPAPKKPRRARARRS